MFKFSVAYMPLLIGFMMLFVILFSDHDYFTGTFTGMIGKVYISFPCVSWGRLGGRVICREMEIKRIGHLW